MAIETIGTITGATQNGGVTCVMVCVITLRSLPVLGRFSLCRSGTHKRQRTYLKPA